MITVKRIQGGTDNCYLVTDSRQAMLVDTASRQNFDMVAAECDRYDMKLIVLTHVHFDHAENAAELSRRYGIPVAIHPRDEELFESYDRQPLKSYGLVGRVVLGLSLKVLKNTPVERPENLVFVKEGDDLSSWGIPAKIIELPGHTLGSVGVDVNGEHLLVGDALDNWILPATGHLFYDRDALRRSAEKIRALGSRTVYYGHGKPTNNR
uniref:Putative beta-lactamase n=1 Tax=uncultured bacterium Contig203 TaxID=1393530 RepID=W0FQ14_9BACT|nr:putative beta-lactamase [uncultured bacterium Contig203]